MNFVRPDPLSFFHSAVAAWFTRAFAAPTEAQRAAWAAITSGHHTLVAAPTGSGKTLAAFLGAIDGLVRQGIDGVLKDETQVVYVSPLKALSNDIERNLEAPLQGIGAELARLALPEVAIRSWVRTGDTPSSERDRMRRRPPHIVVTTPESLYILLGSESGRAMLATTRTVIVDEIHALAPNKRGTHLALSLERLSALCGDRLQRIGLSATQKPIETVGQFLVGSDPTRALTIVDKGYQRARNLVIEVPESPLEAVMSAEVWQQIYDRLAELVGSHRTTLIFVNTRRMAERVTRFLSERVPADQVMAHHGSLAKEHRLDAEQRLKRGELKALVATASLELGIDIGDVDLVCQLGSPRSIGSFLQRVGRSNHSVTGVPEGRLFPLSRDELVECTALIDAVRRGELDRLVVPACPLDVVAQQIVAEAAAREWDTGALFKRVKRAWPYRALSREDFTAIISMLAEGFTTRRGRRGALIHHDAVNGLIRGRRGARLTAITAGGTIPDNADYQVLLEPESTIIGSVNEDFAIESIGGDIFQLGNQSYRIMRVERGVVRVEDAHGLPPTIPFWLGEAPGRSDELSASVSRLRGEIAQRLGAGATVAEVQDWLAAEIGLAEPAAKELAEYLAAGRAALGDLPTLGHVILERFFDEAGGMQLVIHSPYGSRINRAWGLALRKKFCRKFNFELQAAATEDNIILSLTTAHSFELSDVSRYLHSASARDVLVQALLDAPMFQTRWRRVAAVSLALPRFQGGRKVPPQLARMGAEDLVASVFPDQIACAENLTGEREVPDHPLVRQAIDDCLSEAMDIDGLLKLLRGIESGSIRVSARDLTEPSPLALEVLQARPYAFLDDAPLEERRTQAVLARRWIAPEDAAALGKLDAEAVAAVRAEAWPEATNADELHDALVWLGFLTEDEAGAAPGWAKWLGELSREKRVAQLVTAAATLWIAAERLLDFAAVWPQAKLQPPISAPTTPATGAPDAHLALVEIVRGRLEGQGPTALASFARATGLPESDLVAALTALEVEGFAFRGRYSPDATADEWCERRLLARIHQRTVKRLRAEIEPVAARDFLRFLLDWQRVTPEMQMEGPAAVDAIVGQLEGFEAAASAWEGEILPARIAGYESVWLDDRCTAGHIVWTRLRPRSARPTGESRGRPAPVRATPIALFPRRYASMWASLANRGEEIALSPKGESVAAHIRGNGASFFDELVDGTRLLRSQVEEALAELVAHGLVTSDSFGGLRALLVPSAERRLGPGGRRRTRTVKYGMEEAGRWALTRRAPAGSAVSTEAVEHVAQSLLRRYGVVFWRLIEREADWLPHWRDLLRVYRRLENRGEIRGGRFVAGFAGEQFALPDAVTELRRVRSKPLTEELISVSGADPLNLVGILTPGARLPVLTGNRLLYRDGLPIAVLAAGEVTFLETLGPVEEWEAHKALLRGPSSVPSIAPELLEDNSAVAADVSGRAAQ